MVGLLGAVFTGGVSLGLVAAGGVVGAAGVVTAGGATIAEAVIQKLNLINLPDMWVGFCLAVRENEERKGTIIKTERNLLPEMLEEGTGGATAKGTGTAEAGGAAEAATGSGKALGGLKKGVAAGSVALNAVSAGLSLYELIDASLEISRDRKSKPGGFLRELAQSLDKFVQSGEWSE